MKSKWKLTFFAASVAIATAAGVFVAGPLARTARGAEDAPPAGPVPVEPNPHEFMEYVNQPNYRQLRQALAQEPKDEKAWESVTSSSLVLAESGNLLLFRPPNENADAWKRHAVSVREQGSKLYQAAHKKDYSAAKQEFASLLQRCNSCHDEFAGGEPNLKP